MIKKNLLLLLLYAFSLIMGGIVGHRSQSASSLLSVTCGLIIGAGGLALWRQKKEGVLATLFFVSLLTLFFIYRWLLIEKFYPPGAMALFSSLVAISLSWQALALYRQNDSSFTGRK